VSDQKVCPTCGTEYPLSERFCPRDGSALRSAVVSEDLLGSIVADRYHILKKLGEGGMGTVYLAEHVKMGRKSALKVMNPGMNTDPDAIARFNREASNASRLSHPNICGIYDFGETPDGMIYLAMEFIEGSSLTSLIEKAGQLPAPRAASIVHQTADALQVAHDAGIVHRDLKPDNIMVTKNRDGSDLVKVVDFGIAKASSSDAQKVTKTGMVVGTPEYMSPEQLAGDKLDGRSDLYSLGLVAFNCLTGGLPFAAESAQEAMIMRLTDHPRKLADVRPDIVWPDALQATLDRALARDADDRYQSAAQFGRDFAAAIAAMPATQAVDARTMMVGAVSAAKDEVPATRMAAARPSAQTQPMEAPVVAKKSAPAAARPAAAEKSGSKMPMLAGVGGGLAVMVGVGLYMAGIGPFRAEPRAALSGSDTTPALTQQQPPVVQGAPANGASDSVAARRTADSIALLSRPAGSTTRPPAGNTKVPTPVPAPVPTDPAPTSNAGPRIEQWILEVNDAATTKRNLLRIAGEVEALRPSLRGMQLADSWYVEFIALGNAEDFDGACKAARQVVRLHTNAAYVSAAKALADDKNACP
jgi:serine/threonine-protein kinase